MKLQGNMFGFTRRTHKHGNWIYLSPINQNYRILQQSQQLYHTSVHYRSPSLVQKQKKLRDTARMTAFLNRKDAENLPFYQMEDLELQKQCFNSLARFHLENISAKAEDVKSVVLTIQQENVSKNQMIRSLEDENKYLTHKSKIQSELITKLRDQMKEMELSKDTLLTEHSKITDQCSVLEETINTSKRVVAMLNIQNNHLETIAENQCDKIKGLEKIVWACEREIKSLADEIIKLNKTDKSKGNSIFLYACTRCTGNISHTQNECPSIGITCKLCDQEDHFTVACTSKEEFIRPFYIAPSGPYGL